MVGQLREQLVDGQVDTQLLHVAIGADLNCSTLDPCLQSVARLGLEGVGTSPLETSLTRCLDNRSSDGVFALLLGMAGVVAINSSAKMLI